MILPSHSLNVHALISSEGGCQIFSQISLISNEDGVKYLTPYSVDASSKDSIRGHLSFHLSSMRLIFCMWETAKQVLLQTVKTKINAAKCCSSSVSTLFVRIKKIFRQKEYNT